MSKHTPGPWMYVARDNVICSQAHSRIIDVQPRSLTVSAEERNANGYLAAAAPALLAVCKDAQSHIEELREAWRTGALRDTDGRGGQRSNRNVDVDVALCAAIAKAENAV